MVIKNVNLETVCGITSKMPENELIEFAFAGKSNVGKSSLINGLMNRKSLARTVDEQEILCKDIPAAGKDTDNKLLQHQ